jgi:HSP20 family protein
MHTLISFEPRGPFNRWQGDFDRWFDGFEHAVNQNQWVPAMDIQDMGEAFLMRADLPGVEAKDLELQLADGILSIKGKRLIESDNKRYSWTERRSGSFLRRFKLPEAAGGEISAKLVNGVLEVRIPKPDKLQPRRIEVSA